MSVAPPTLAVVVGTYPSTSETFVARELDGLRRHGVPLVLG